MLLYPFKGLISLFSIMFVAGICYSPQQAVADEVNVHSCGSATIGDSNYTFINCSTFSNADISLLAQKIGKNILAGMAQNASIIANYRLNSSAFSDNSATTLDTVFRPNRLNSEPPAVQKAFSFAKQAIESGDYKSAINYALVAYGNANYSDNALVFGEVVTSSLFAAGQHVRGLQFMCERYKNLPITDFRFKHDIHSHLRALAINEGYNTAFAALLYIRKFLNCNRKDFSPVWAAIPIEIGWSIKKGKTRKQIYESTGPIDEPDLKMLRRLSDSNAPFSDYALFVLRDFDQLISRYPNSDLYSLAQIGNIEFEQHNKKLIKRAHSFVHSSKNAEEVAYVQSLMVATLSKTGDFSEAAKISSSISKLNYDQFTYRTEHWRELDGPFEIYDKGQRQKLDLVNKALESNQFRKALSILREIVQTSKELSEAPYSINSSALKVCEEKYLAKVLIPQTILNTNDNAGSGDREDNLINNAYQELVEGHCQPFQLSKELAKQEIFNLSGFMEASLVKTPHLFSSAFDFYRKLFSNIKFSRDRELLELALMMERCLDDPSNAHDQCFVVQWAFGRQLMHNVLFAIYRKCSASCSPEFSVRAKYIHASHLKRHGDYDQALALYNSIVRENSTSHLIDDALTEIGWYHFAIRNDAEKATVVLEQVVKSYKDRNAYDNALNWLAIIAKHSGNFTDAVKYSIMLGSDIASNRIRFFADERLEELRLLSDEVLSRHISNSVVLCLDWTNFFGSAADASYVKICDIETGSLAWQRGLRKGMTVDALEEREINNVYDIALAWEELGPNAVVSFSSYSLAENEEVFVDLKLSDFIGK